MRFYSVPENSVVFPYEPMAILETTLIDSRILEGMVLADYNFSSLSASKWHRIKNAALGRPVMEFGRRRAQDGLRASLYSYVAGIDSTGGPWQKEFREVLPPGRVISSMESRYANYIQRTSGNGQLRFFG